jgi:hypothetical protein
MWRTRTRVIGIDPTSKGFAWVVLEGTDRLVDSGTCRVPKLKPRDYRARVKSLFERYSPSAVVLERTRGSRRSKRVVKLIRDLEKLAVKYGLTVRRVSREDVRKVFAQTGWRKHEIAEAIVGSYPALAECLPPKRRAWEAEREGMNVFDAFSFVVAAMGPVGKEVR